PVSGPGAGAHTGGTRDSGFGIWQRNPRRIPNPRRVPSPESQIPMMSLNAIVPMLCVTAAAIAAMVAEAFRSPGERMPIGPLGAIGLAGAAMGCALLWNHNASSFGVVQADNFGLFVTWVLIVVGLLSLAFSGPTIAREH